MELTLGRGMWGMQHCPAHPNGVLLPTGPWKYRVHGAELQGQAALMHMGMQGSGNAGTAPCTGLFTWRSELWRHHTQGAKEYV